MAEAMFCPFLPYTLKELAASPFFFLEPWGSMKEIQASLLETEAVQRSTEAPNTSEDAKLDAQPGLQMIPAPPVHWL